MTLKDLLKKKDKLQADDAPSRGDLAPPEIPEFTFIRTTTNTQELISPPSYPGDRTRQRSLSTNAAAQPGHRFRKSSNASSIGPTSFGRTSNDRSRPPSSKSERRLSGRLHLYSRSRSVSTSSINVPAGLPEIEGKVAARKEEDQEEWERRATLLAKGSPLSRPGSSAGNTAGPERGTAGRTAPEPTVSYEGGDANIQEAIRLHEAGDLERSTVMFGKLADPDGANNALSQVLYGLALRHGWGCRPDPEKAITYLSHAATNSAEIESQALQAGMKKGGAAKGELVLAIFELANCFRHGWGAKKDAVAAKQYYETAANLGDTDAMNEVAWCYQEGFGCKKDKFKAAQYLRLAEEKGSKTLGNTWIWKPKYDPPK